MRVEDIMSKEVKVISPTEPAEVAYEQMRLHRIHHLVVMQGRTLLGVISERDLGGARGQALRANRRVEELMSPAAVSVAPDETVRRAANMMRGQTIGCVPVLERGKLLGIVTVSDMLELVGRAGSPPEHAAPARVKQVRRMAAAPRRAALRKPRSGRTR